MKDEALKLALEALETELSIDWTNNDEINASAEKMQEAITAIKQARSAPVQSCYCPNCEAMGKELAALKAQPAPVQEPVQVWQAEGYGALMQEMQMVKARNIRQHAEIERLSALVRAQQITIDKLEAQQEKDT
jgi:hypothetical protein